MTKYNNEIKKIAKLFTMLVTTYFIITKFSEISIQNNNLVKILIMVGIVYIILENYYPTFPIYSIQSESN